MFNLSPDREATPATAAQIAYLGKLIARYGKEAYQAAKIRCDIPIETTLLRLSKWQAARLIRELITSRGQR